ncbi:AAA family ATPase [Buttiauxella gaviniae]|uniref:AAA family ATPase n=1 Tax=Buttiauxella gaviniae TaxID=82990 RepID=A0ABV3NT16_9ENTR
MKISKIEFIKLFGVFDHSINLNEEGGITIIIGENGLGKTVILEAINALFNRQYNFFHKITFEKLIITFDTKDTWSFRKGKQQTNASQLFITKGANGKNESKEYLIKDGLPPNISKHDLFKRRMMQREYLRRRNIQFAENIYDSRLIDGSIINEMDMIERSIWNEHLINEYDSHNDKNVQNPKWFEEALDAINIRLIETQRIIGRKDLNSDVILNPVEYYSKELKEMIVQAVKESSNVASSLDSTYPNRLISELKRGADDSFEELNDALAKLNDRRKLLSSVGLIIDSEDNDLLQIEKNQEDLITILKIYIDDSHKKLAPFEEISKKIKLFKEIINTRFKHKKLEVTQGEGITFKSTVITNRDNKSVNIPSTGLSSGEQNELILFYKLIFNSQPNDMILIDEPELSLHISWQNKFIEDIKDIISINDLSVIIATHSPDIISHNWELMIELQGVE